MKSSFDKSKFLFKGTKNHDEQHNSSLSPLTPLPQRTNIYNIILINYRWDGELKLDRGRSPLSDKFPFPSGLTETKKSRLTLGKGQG